MNTQNPLFPQPPDSPQAAKPNAAVELIRSKVQRAYSAEPDASQELAEVETAKTLSKHQLYMQSLSASGKSLAEIQTEWHHYYTTLNDAEKHEVWQEFYAANQHTPYQKLFQKQQEAAARKRETAVEPTGTPAIKAVAGPITQAPQTYTSPTGVVVATHNAPDLAPTNPAATVAPITSANTTATRKLKRKIANRVSANGKLTMKHHLQSLGFGLAIGFVVLFSLLFTFF